MHIAFDNSYARLPERMYARLKPTEVAAPKLIRVNTALAEILGLDPAALSTPDWVGVLAGNRLPPGAAPIATAYAGHQFGGFVPQLGDGRAILLGEVVGRDGVRRDIQLKGAGRTPFSRGGDGRAAIGPVLREYLVSEAAAALGIPTTRALAAVATGEYVFREAALPGAVLTRVAQSHIRVGTFQYFAARGDDAALKALADHVIVRHYPDAATADRPYRALLEAVVARQADLIAAWLLVGFIHGVMNTDNCSIAGETIDYGPCAFLDIYEPAKVFSAIDHAGRYAFANQPNIALWNLTRLAETMLGLLAENEQAAVASAQQALATFAPRFTATYTAGLCRKIGLDNTAENAALALDFLARMEAGAADFTLTFRQLCDAAAGPAGDAAVRAQFADPHAYDGWAVHWRQRGAPATAARRAAMQAVNPCFIPRNHLVEAALRAATDHADFAPFHTLVDILAHPYQDRPEAMRYAAAPSENERVTRTYCGT
jgi:uncharacterized protein YdiU (UPF0061 family)